MPNPFFLRIHPEDTATGAALVAAVAGAAGLGRHGVRVAWNFRPSTRMGYTRMIQAAEQRITVPRSSFSFDHGLSPVTPGLCDTGGAGDFPHLGDVEDDHRHCGLALDALAQYVLTGGLGILVSNKLHTAQGDIPPAPAFSSGILHILPGHLSNPEDEEANPFVAAGFPTLVIGRHAERCTASAHERLDLCGALVARMAADLSSGRAG